MSKKVKLLITFYRTLRIIRSGLVLLYRKGKPIIRSLHTHVWPRMKQHRNGLIVLSAILVSASAVYSFLTVSEAASSPLDSPVKISKAEMDPGKGKPAYDTVLPSGKTIEDLGGWTRVSPSDRNPVFAYVDNIKDTPINVSQQPVPEEFKPNVDEQISHMAASYLAKEKVVVGDTTIFIGTSGKGPQSVIFSKNDLLILMKSSIKISPSDWGTYVGSLE